MEMPCLKLSTLCAQNCQHLHYLTIMQKFEYWKKSMQNKTKYTQQKKNNTLTKCCSGWAESPQKSRRYHLYAYEFALNAKPACQISVESLKTSPCGN